MNVFLVDDSVIIRERLKRLLADMVQVQVVGEAGSVQPMDAILEHKPDVVLIDIPLFNRTGLNLLRALKKISQPPAVIILTNDTYPQYRQECLEDGADFFFVISNEFDLIVPALKQLMQQTSDDGRASAPIPP